MWLKVKNWQVAARMKKVCIFKHCILLIKYGKTFWTNILVKVYKIPTATTPNPLSIKIMESTDIANFTYESDYQQPPDDYQQDWWNYLFFNKIIS